MSVLEGTKNVIYMCHLGDRAFMFVGLNGGRKNCGHKTFVICERSFKRYF